MLDSLTGVLGATEEDDVGASWGTESELVECDGLTTSLLDTGTSSGGELERTDAELWELKETVVIGDGTDNGADLALVDLGGVLVGGDGDDLGEGHWWGVDARHTQSVWLHCQMLLVPPPHHVCLHVFFHVFHRQQTTHLLKTVALNLLSVRRFKNSYNLCRILRYGLVLAGA